MKLYRNNYLIGIYGPEREGEPLLALVDNISQFAELMEITKLNAANILSNLFNKKYDSIRFLGRLCKVEFIEVEEDE